MIAGAGRPESGGHTADDLGYHRGGSENSNGRGVAQHRFDPLVGDTTHRDRQRNGDHSGMQRTEESDDVVQPLRRDDHRAVTGRGGQPELTGHVGDPPVQLRPRQADRDAGPVLVIVDKGVRRVVRLHTGPLAQQCRKRSLDRLCHAKQAIKGRCPDSFEPGFV